MLFTGKRSENVKYAKSEMRKTQIKRQRIPRRGPGVAELEKILKEQEGQDSDPQFQDISPPPPPPPSPPPPPPFLFQPHHPSPSTPPSLNNPPRPPPPPLPFLPPRDYSSWPNLPSFPTFGLIPPALPPAADAAEKTVFPTTTPKSDTEMTNIPPHFFPHYQFSASSFNRQYYNSMVNFIPGSASSSPSASSSAARYFHQIEHPSSQRSTDFNHTWTSPDEQEQMVNAKRARPFLDESHGDPNYQSRRSIPIFSNMAVKDSSSSSSSSLEINRTAINLDSNFRGSKRGFSKSSGSYQLAEDSSNLLALGSSSSTPNQFAPFDFQEIREASQHRDEGGSASDYNKITFNSSSFYESNAKSKSKGILVAAIGTEAKAEDEDEAKTDGIDLDLKL